MTTALATIEEGSGRPLARFNESNPIGAMLQAVLEKGITQENVAAMEKLTDLYIKVEASYAKKDFARAKAAMQAELPKVFASKVVQNRGRYAPYSEIMDTIQPHLTKYGFTISGSQRMEAGFNVAIFTLSHTSGHSEVTEFAVRSGGGKPNAGALELAQEDAKASSLAMRYALRRALNITDTDEEGDARLAGEYITDEQARQLEDRLLAVGANIGKFLTFAKADTFGRIRTAMYPEVLKAVGKKEQQAQQASGGN